MPPTRPAQLISAGGYNSDHRSHDAARGVITGRELSHRRTRARRADPAL